MTTTATAAAVATLASLFDEDIEEEVPRRPSMNPSAVSTSSARPQTWPAATVHSTVSREAPANADDEDESAIVVPADNPP